MASIIISFVGNQDPYSDHTKEEGSIVTLVKHLIAQKQEIKQILLLGTSGTKERAEFTKEWLHTEIEIPEASIEISVVAESLSQDPVNILLASNEAKQAIERVKNIITDTDYLELNASSGTPAMKSTWSILQAAGYAPRSHVWQVRNPKEMQAGQDRVFATDVSVLKTEFDRNIIKQQLADYNYSGALATIRSSSLTTPIIEALLNYGHRRRSFDFDRANLAIQVIDKDVAADLSTDIARLRQKDKLSLLQEVYFIAEISIKNSEYCDFLIAVAQFQENFLKYQLASLDLPVPDRPQNMHEFWSKLKTIDEGKIFRDLEKARCQKSSIVSNGNINIPTQIKILELMNVDRKLLDTIESLKNYCEDRNAYIHRLAGVSQIDEAESILRKIKSILKQLTKFPDRNPFDLLNDLILGLLP